MESLKKIKILLAVVSCFFISSGLFSQTKSPRKATVVIKSSVECEFCKSNVEKKLSKIKGVQKVTADYKTHEITVRYNSRRIKIEEIKKAISDFGYDADEIPANNRMNTILKHKQGELK